MVSEAVNILLVEDNDVDVEAVRRALRKHQIVNPITVALDGIEALEHLRGQAGCTRLTRPYIILLDLNLPRMSGIEFLTELRSDSAIKDSVVFVFTTSNQTEDKLATYNLNIAGYIVKNEVGRDFMNLVELLDSYWRIVELPPNHLADLRND